MFRNTPRCWRFATFLGVPAIVLGLYLFLVGMLMIPDDPLYRSAIIVSGIPASTAGIADVLCNTATRVAPVVVALLMLVFGGKRRYRLAAAVLLSAIIVGLGTEGVKHILGRVRPDALNGANIFTWLQPGGMYHSFPSGHASNAACLAFVIAIAWPRLRWPVAIWTCAVGVSRVLLDRHFPGDVVAGWGVGLAVTHIVLWRMRLVPDPWRMLRLFFRQRAILNGLLIGVVIVAAVPTDATNHLGLQIVLLGLIGRAWALAHYDHTLPSGGATGPYALVRHPQCLSSLIVAIGVAIMANSWVLGLLVLAASVVAHLSWIRAEDGRQLRLFGEEYRLRVNTIPALVPLPHSVLKSAWATGSDWRRAVATGAFAPVPLFILCYGLMEIKEAFLAPAMGGEQVLRHIAHLLS